MKRVIPIFAAALLNLTLAGADLPKRGICGHQGWLWKYPGNTLEGISAAVRLKVAMVEFDTRRCKSGEFVLSHDGIAEHPVLGKKRISDLTLAELGECRLERAGKKYRIPTLDEALKVIPSDGIWMNVDCYCGFGNLQDLVRHFKARGRIGQSCFRGDIRDIVEMRKAVPELIANNGERTGPRDRDWTDEECQKYVDATLANKCLFLQLSRPWARKYSDACHAAGVKVILYHCEDARELQDLFARGIDFVMSNHTGELQAAYVGAAMGSDPMEERVNCAPLADED